MERTLVECAAAKSNEKTSFVASGQQLVHVCRLIKAIMVCLMLLCIFVFSVEHGLMALIVLNRQTG